MNQTASWPVLLSDLTWKLVTRYKFSLLATRSAFFPTGLSGMENASSYEFLIKSFSKNWLRYSLVHAVQDQMTKLS